MTNERFLTITNSLVAISKKRDATKKIEQYLNMLSPLERDLAERFRMRAFYVWLRPQLEKKKQQQIMGELIEQLHTVFCKNSGARPS